MLLDCALFTMIYHAGLRIPKASAASSLQRFGCAPFAGHGGS